ncbi:DUF350 domain-containing protein [Marinobacterium sp. D7]|uniref:DUF350 domain-containing protein n=1 Tax=Marinobacterium ramblicola TaxID=2849041 RepID=UPI001C2CEC92|nr:DUF350 domain-containing protein [Marinobacterium ramblicola]MBV1787411.1 DUF350 domain-containing protein [Marinobacterium ramblicola]
MDTILHSLQGLTGFGLYFLISIVALMCFKFLYTRITPHNEWKLIKEKHNTAAAWAFGGATLGFAIALGGAAANSVNLQDFVVWAVVALIAQLLAFTIVRVIYMPRIVTRIENDEVPAGLMVCFISISIGILNASCLTY